ncbi:hypothetical protein [Paenibacillus hunanensis]|uniref:MFS transporter permease n=1 Tax=Paenibacillus hunanensis TaxID=539262 RepID=A0ABU1IYN6_9BACL|nr:hypothetical protein [Paenibacillus hunanensis]MDR6243477.1 hypothetical protein [Paenibacillus hunanensis]
MIRFVWLVLSLGGWAYLYSRTPDWSGWWTWLPALGALLVYMYGWVLEQRNQVLVFFTCLLWSGVALALKGQVWLIKQPTFPISSVTGLHVLLVIGLLASLFLTFANHRMQHNLMNRRGNVSKQQLVVVKPTVSDRWKAIKRVFTRSKSTDIQLNLGEEIPMKE